MEGIKTRKPWLAGVAAFGLIFGANTSDNVTPTQWTSLSEQGNLKAVVPVARGSTDHQLVKPKLVEAYGKLPLSFEANQGQSDGQVKFLSRGRGYTLFLISNGAVLALTRPGVVERVSPEDFPLPLRERARGSEVVGGAHPFIPRSLTPEPRSQTVVRMQLVGANPNPEIEGLEELPGRSNYFIGNDPEKWRTNVPTYAKVKYVGVYAGIDLVYYGKQSQLEYDFLVAPGADPNVIKLAFQGAEKAETDPNGDLLLHVAGGEIHLKNPNVYQVVDGVRRTIPGNYLLTPTSMVQSPKSDLVGFQVAAYDASKPLVIDPVLSYSTYLGGGGDDFGLGIAVDPSGNAYITGYTDSTNFPTANSFQTDLGGSDAIVAKLDPTGTSLLYSTYLGGSQGDFASGIAVDLLGNAYVTTGTCSPNFPTVNAFQTNQTGCLTVTVSKFNPTGSALLYSTYLGGSRHQMALGVAVDSLGNAYVAGDTYSSDFPATTGAFDTKCGTDGNCNFNGRLFFSDFFVAKLNTSTSGSASLVYSTYLGGSSDEFSSVAIAIDSDGNAHVVGRTRSLDFPTVNALQASHRGGTDAIVAKLNAAGSALVYSTYLGGTADDQPGGIAVDSIGNAYVAGTTVSADFPVVNALQPVSGGSGGIFLSKLHPSGSAFIYSTYLGGPGFGVVGSGIGSSSGVAVDPLGSVYITGKTRSGNFSVVNAFQPVLAGSDDAFVMKLDPQGSALVYSTYLGGSGRDESVSIAVDSDGNAYVAGFTTSTNFPTSIALQPALAGFGAGGYGDAFVAKLGRFVPGQGEPISDEEVAVDYSVPNWRFLLQPPGAQIAGFQQAGFDDSSWQSGAAPFGSTTCNGIGMCPLDSNASTCWSSQTTLFLRKTFAVPLGTTNVDVKVRANSSTDVTVFVNGTQIGSGTASACASELESFSFSTTNIAGTGNLVAIRAENFLASAFMDVQVSFQADAQVLGPLATGSYNLGETQILSGGQVVIPFTSPGHPLAVSKQFIPFPPRAGEPNIYRVFVSNISASPATVAFVSIAVGNFGIGEALFPAGETSPNTVINPGETKQFDIVWTPWSTGHQCSRVYVGYFASDLKVMVTQWDLDVVHGIPTIDTAVNEYTVYNRFFDDRNFYLRFTQRNFPAGWTLTSSVPGPPPGSIPEEPSDPGFFATIPAKSTRIFTLTVNPNGIAGIGSVVVEGWLAFADTTACPFSQDERGAPVAQIFKNLGLGGPSDDVLCKLGFLVKTVQASAPVPDITVSPLSLSFGGVCLGSSADLSTTVTNDGGSNLVMGSVTSPALPFAIVTDTCSTQTLAPGGSCSVTVQFSPATLASFSSFFTVPSNDPDEPAVTVSLSGVGIGADIDATPNPVNFGNVSLGSFVDQAITVSNVAAACDLSISSVTAPAAPFSIVSSTCTGATLAPGDFCALTARFAPTALASFADSIGIDSNDPDENPFPVSLSGTGVNDVDLVGTWSPLGPSFCTPGGMPRARGRFQVSNAGTASSGVGFQVQVFASTDAILDPADTLVTTVGRPPCLGGSNCGGPVVIGPGAGIPCGRYLIGVADTLDQVSETNETNNVSVTATP